MEKFILVCDKNDILPASLWTTYEVELQEDRMICTLKKDKQVELTILYSQFTRAEFGIGNGNLWLQCQLGDKKLDFCSPRKSWKGEAGQYLIKKINEVTEIIDMKEYKGYTGPFFFFKMFK